MAKKKDEFAQIDLFPVSPEIRGLSITEFKIKEGTVSANLNGVTMMTDVAAVTDETWRKSIAEWLVALCSNNGGMIDGYIDEARQRAYELERERELTKAAIDAANNVKNFPSGVVGSFA